MRRPPPANAPTPELASWAPRTTTFDDAKKQRHHESNREASKCYREKNREKVLEAGWLRAAECRARHHGDPEFRARARVASTRYRERNREEVAHEQCEVRKKAYIRKHGVSAYAERRHGDPVTPSRVPTSPVRLANEYDEEDAEDADDEEETLSHPFWNWDNDPFLRRKPVPAAYRY